MEIHVATLYRYKDKYHEICESLKKGKEVADYEVENALFKKATGYTETFEKIKVTKDGDIVNYTEKIHYAPDTTAIIYWLKNRRPDKWRDKQEKVNNDNAVNNNILNIANLINNPQPNRSEKNV